MTQADHDGTEPVTMRRQLTRIVREHAGRLAAALMRVTGDFAFILSGLSSAVRRVYPTSVPDQG